MRSAAPNLLAQAIAGATDQIEGADNIITVAMCCGGPPEKRVATVMVRAEAHPPTGGVTITVSRYVNAGDLLTDGPNLLGRRVQECDAEVTRLYEEGGYDGQR